MNATNGAQINGSSFGGDEELAKEQPPNWTLAKFQEDVRSALNEYFVARALDEAVSRTRELLASCPADADEFGVLAIRSSLDRDPSAMQAVVELFKTLHAASVLTSSAFVRSFEKLFCTWEDITIDAPKAPETLLTILLGCFAAGVCERSLLSKIPENLMNAGLASNSPMLSAGLDGSAKRPEGEPNGLEQLRNSAAELKEFKHQASKVIDHFFATLDSGEVASRLKEIGSENYHHEFAKKGMMTSFSQPKPEDSRDNTLRLFQELIDAKTLTKDDLQWGVTRLLGQLDDLSLDTPRASELTIELLSCLVSDELVSAPFLRRCRLLRIGGPSGLKVLDATQRRTPEHFKKHLGTTQFKAEIKDMILEFFNSGDEGEFGRCVSELTPLSDERSAELVRKIMSMAMERSGADCEQALRLLIWLCRHEEISMEALELGFNDLYKQMPDLLLDVPDAEDMAKAFVVEAKKANVLRSDWN